MSRSVPLWEDAKPQMPDGRDFLSIPERSAAQRIRRSVDHASSSVGSGRTVVAIPPRRG